MIKYQIVYWRDIPAQVKVKAGRNRAGRPLSDRFAVAIDEAAMRAGLTGSDDYLTQWRNSEWREREGGLEEVVDALVVELEDAYPPARLHTLIRQHGLEEDKE
ncbi:MAG: virulence factor [Anaerolineaceae bacterium]|nr:MAG: virulence factor [Anaerolineaceae bacterium]